MRKDIPRDSVSSVGFTKVDGPLGSHYVSTVRLSGRLASLDLIIGMFDDRLRAPGEYESMVFDAAAWDKGDVADHLHVARYEGEAEAKEGHEEIVNDLLAGTIALIHASTYAGFDDGDEEKEE